MKEEAHYNQKKKKRTKTKTIQIINRIDPLSHRKLVIFHTNGRIDSIEVCGSHTLFATKKSLFCSSASRRISKKSTPIRE